MSFLDDLQKGFGSILDGSAFGIVPFAPGSSIQIPGAGPNDNATGSNVLDKIFPPPIVAKQNQDALTKPITDAGKSIGDSITKAFSDAGNAATPVLHDYGIRLVIVLIILIAINHLLNGGKE